MEKNVSDVDNLLSGILKRKHVQFVQKILYMIRNSNNVKAVQMVMVMINRIKHVYYRSQLAKTERYITKTKKFVNVQKKNHTFLTNVSLATCLISGIRLKKNVKNVLGMHTTIRQKKNV